MSSKLPDFSLTILCDTRENNNKHILNYFNSHDIPYINQALSFGDYSCVANIAGQSVAFDDKFVIERKNSLNELSGNITQHRERFEREFTRAKNAKLLVMVEETCGWESIIQHKYTTNIAEKSFLATLFTYSHRFNIETQFIEKKYAGLFVYWQMYYFVREYVKNNCNNNWLAVYIAQIK